MALAAILLPAIGACSTKSDASTSSDASTEVSVHVAGFKFSQPDVRVPLGGTVVWNNDDSQPHTATSAGAFDAGTIEPGKTAVVVFRTAGTFTYICSFHPFMTGTVAVG
jgi:plastocyanin